MEKYYDAIFKRKSFHLFKDHKNKIFFKDENKISKDELDDIYKVFKAFKPLINEIKVEIKIVENDLTNCNRYQEYCILFYSEKKNNYLQNIGYLGEQLDLYLASKNIGALWYGIGKTKQIAYDGLHFVTMMAICKVKENNFRRDMFKSKRKPIEEIWNGNKYLNIANIARFAPSSCNTQPWIVKENDNKLLVYRYKKPGKRGIMPINKVVYQNLIDIGIFILFLDVILSKNNIKHSINVYGDNEENNNELTLSAKIDLN